MLNHAKPQSIYPLFHFQNKPQDFLTKHIHTSDTLSTFMLPLERAVSALAATLGTTYLTKEPSS